MSLEKVLKKEYEWGKMTKEQYETAMKYANKYKNVETIDCITRAANELYANEFVKLTATKLTKYNRYDRESNFVVKIKNTKYKIAVNAFGSKISNLSFTKIEKHFEAVKKAVNYINNTKKLTFEFHCGLEEIKELREEMYRNLKKDDCYHMYLHFIESEIIQSTTDLIGCKLISDSKSVVNSFEYKKVSEADVQALKNAGVEFDCVVDSSGKNDYIIKYEKAISQQVQEIISNSLNSSLKR